MTRRLSLILIALLLLNVTPPIRAAADLILPAEADLTNPAFAREGHAGIAAPFLKQTRYLLAFDVDWLHGKITGRADILYVNNTPDTLNSVIFRLYPNHPVPAVYADTYTAAKPRMLIQSVSVGGVAVKWNTAADVYQTVLEVPLTAALAPGTQADILVDYSVAYTSPTDSLDVREAFPLLAVYENGAWRKEITTKSLDFVFSETALYAVTIHTSRDISLYCVGSITHTDVTDTGITYHITTGPVRDFVFLLTKGWGFMVGKGGPVQIDVRYRGSDALAQEETDIAVRAMNYYDKTFGAYPYAHLTMLVLSYPTGGEEYPTLIFNDNARDIGYRRFITAHEVAHQWFYGVAGNDIARHAWLDESLAQISLYLFYYDVYGSAVAEQEWTYIQVWAKRLKGTARPIDTAVATFTDFSDYMTHTYGLGAVFMRSLAERIGFAPFKAGLAAYYQAAYLKVGTPQQFFDAMQAQTADDLKPLFCSQMGFPCAKS